MECERIYHLRRGLEEALAAWRAKHPEARTAHLELALRHRARADAMVPPQPRAAA